MAGLSNALNPATFLIFMANHLIDLTNRKVGSYIVLERDFSQSYKSPHWKCQCLSCNRIHIISGAHLRDNTKPNRCSCERELKVGQQFGELIVLSKDEEKSNKGSGSHYWCQCSCGNIISVKRTQLTRTSNSQKSCGCLQSKGETIIADILIKNDISFNQQFQFSDLKNKNLLRFDFAILNDDNNIERLIEFDGYLHFGYKTSGWMTKQRHLDCVKNDNLKNEYAKSHNIPLVRIPYTEINNINLDMLLGDKFLI